MVAVDTNILVKAHRIDAARHMDARRCIAQLAESPTPWAICYHTFVEFYSVATNPKIWKTPSLPSEATGQIRKWCESPSLTILSDSPAGLPGLLSLVESSAVKGAVVHDARVASCCLNHGVREFWTIDRDFSRFPALKTQNPLLQA